MTDKAVIEGLKKSDSITLDFIYTNYRLDFLNFAKKYPLSNETLVDIYQDAIIALRENALNGKIDNIKSQLKTYLFSIGKYMIYNTLKQQKKIHLVNDIESVDFKYEEQVHYNGPTDQQIQFHIAFKTLGKKCKSILTLFYYRGFDIEDIKNELNYTSKDVVKSQKSRCLKSLKDMVLKK